MAVPKVGVTIGVFYVMALVLTRAYSGLGHLEELIKYRMELNNIELLVEARVTYD